MDMATPVSSSGSETFQGVDRTRPHEQADEFAD
jgi:hypothetical protein